MQTNLPFVRPEILVDPNPNASAEVQRPLSAFESLYRMGWLRKTVILLVLALIWEVYGRWLDNALLFPSFSEVSSNLEVIVSPKSFSASPRPMDRL